MSRYRFIISCGWLLCLAIAAVALAQQKAQVQQKAPSQQTDSEEKPAPSAALRVLDQATQDEKFTFLVFYKTETPAAQAMVKVARDGVARRKGKSVVAFVQVTDPAEKALVDQFDVARSPMPLTLAVAPNRAITGVFSKELKDENFDAAIVTPTMTRCMKSLQAGKLVFVCLNVSDKDAAPPCVKAMQLDPEFSARVVAVSMDVRDPQETRFLQQMQIDPRQVKTPVAALLAPPGLLIGKYDGAATKDEVAAALHSAGKCCDDPNCKHNHGTSTQRPANSRRK